MPQLRIEQEDIEIERLPMDTLKSAVAFVNEQPDLPPNQKYVYVTINEKTRIENTVVIRKTKTQSQWT